MRRSQGISTGVSPTIGAALILAIVVAGFVMVTVSSFEFFNALITENADATFSFTEIGDNEIEIKMIENQNLEVARAIMPNGDEYYFHNAGDSERITIKEAGSIEIIGEVKSTGESELIRTYSPNNTRAISGNVSYNPGVEDIRVELERSGTVVLTQLTDKDGSFSLVPPSNSTYDINVEDADTVVALVPPGSEGHNIDIQDDIINEGKTDSKNVADFIMSGNGTANNPYKIDSIADLQAVRTNKSAHYIINKDLNASITNDSTWNGGFEYIGTGSNPFNGTVETNGDVTISDLKMNKSNVAIFENVTSNSSIQAGSITALTQDGSNINILPHRIVSYNFPNTVIEGREIEGNLTVNSEGELTVEIPNIDSSTQQVSMTDDTDQKVVDFRLDSSIRDIGSYTGNLDFEGVTETTPIDIILPESADKPVISNVEVPHHISSSAGYFEVSIEFLNMGSTTISGANMTLNPGDISASSKDVSLRDLDPGQSQAITTKFNIDSSDEGNYKFSVTGPNSTSATDYYNITNDPKMFDITNFEVVGDPLEGEEIKFNISVQNTKTKTETQTIYVSSNDLSAGGSKSITLEPSQKTDLMIKSTTVLNNVGSYSFTASSSSDSKSKEINIGSNDSGGMTTEVVNPTNKRSYTEGNSIDVTVEVRNDGDNTDTPELSIKLLNANGDVVDTKLPSTSSIASGSKTQYSASFPTSDLATGDYKVVSETGDDTGSMKLSVVEGSSVIISDTTIQNANNEVTLGGTLRVDIELENKLASSSSGTLSVETQSSNSLNSTSYTVHSSESDVYRIPLQISESENTGNTSIIIVIGNDQVSRSINITSP